MIGWFTSKTSGALVLMLLYSEFITYWTLPWSWFDHPPCPPPHCKKLLLISDPQIVGPEWRWFQFIDMLAEWDSDRYLKRTFESAVNYLQPDVLIFLGDLIDQGHLATDSDFWSYVDRLKSIFGEMIMLQGPKLILLPGDNDIGGVDDVLLPRYVRRFNKVFNQTEDCTLTEFIEFCKVNLMTVSLQQSKFVNGDSIRVSLSHVPILPRDNYYLNEVVRKIRPQLIFSGHEHKSFHYTVNETDLWHNERTEILPSDGTTKVYKLRDSLIHEIIIPTCSYRMGVFDMGYGAAFIDTKKRLIYFNVLWLPDRFLQLFLYLAMFTAFLFYWFFVRIRKNLQRKLLKSPRSLYASFI